MGGGARGREFRCKGPGSAFGTPEPHAVAARKLDCDLVADEFEGLLTTIPSRTIPRETLDISEFLARVLTQIPEPRRHGPHYFGAYSSRVRALRNEQGLELQPASLREARDVHVYFDNDAFGHAPRNALRLIDRIAGSHG